MWTETNGNSDLLVVKPINQDEPPSSRFPEIKNNQTKAKGKSPKEHFKLNFYYIINN